MVRRIISFCISWLLCIFVNTISILVLIGQSNFGFLLKKHKICGINKTIAHITCCPINITVRIRSNIINNRTNITTNNTISLTPCWELASLQKQKLYRLPVLFNTDGNALFHRSYSYNYIVSWFNINVNIYLFILYIFVL